MRLHFTFVVLLMVASAGASLAWTGLAGARDGQPVAAFLALAAGVLAIASLFLLARIVYVVTRRRPAEVS